MTTNTFIKKGANEASAFGRNRVIRLFVLVIVFLVLALLPTMTEGYLVTLFIEHDVK